PVEEVDARIVGIRVGVEEVLHRVFADLKGDAVDIFFTRELAILAVDLLALAAQADLLSQEKARYVEARIRIVRLLRLAVGIAARASGVGDAEAVQRLGIEVELAALPQAHTEKARHGPGLPALALRRQAVRSAVERIDRRIALIDECGLAMDFPGARTAVVTV